MYFEIYRQGASLLSGEWRWRLKAGNNKIVASGESYRNKEDCEHAVALLKSTNLYTPVHFV